MDEFIIEQAKGLQDCPTEEYEYIRLTLLMRYRTKVKRSPTRIAEEEYYLVRLMFGIADRLRPLLLEGSTT